MEQNSVLFRVPGATSAPHYLTNYINQSIASLSQMVNVPGEKSILLQTSQEKACCP